MGKLTRVGLIVDRIDPLSDRFIKASQAAAKELGISAQWSEAPTPDDIEKAFATFAGQCCPNCEVLTVAARSRV